MRITDEQRRVHLAARHHLERSAAGVDDLARAAVAVHSSDPVTPYLAAWARIPGFETADLDRALYVERTLVRVHAMRRTLFVVPSEDRALFDAAAGRDVARKERRRLLGWLEAEMDPELAGGWLAEVEEAALAALEDGELTTRQLTDRVPGLATQVALGSGKWSTRSPVSSRVLFLMALDGRIVRGRPGGSWRSSQYAWTRADQWFDEPADEMEPDEARAELARRYLLAHGPATVTDLRWWTGWTVAHTKAALAALDVREVDLDSGAGLVLADGSWELAAPEGPAVALLPGLDPTPMGWKERAWYIGEVADPHYDDNGNAGPMVLVDGRAVGAWAQRADGEVVVRLLVEVDDEVRTAVAERARELTAWLDGVVVSARFPSPLHRELAGS